jgi:hypothetical protein
MKVIQVLSVKLIDRIDTLCLFNALNFFLVAFFLYSCHSTFPQGRLLQLNMHSLYVCIIDNVRVPINTATYVAEFFLSSKQLLEICLELILDKCIPSSSNF